MDIVTFALIAVLAVSVWKHKEKIDGQSKKIEKLEQAQTCAKDSIK